MRWAGLIGCFQARPCARIGRSSTMRKGAVAVTVAVSGAANPLERVWLGL